MLTIFNILYFSVTNKNKPIYFLFILVLTIRRSTDTLYKIAKALDVSMECLIEEEMETSFSQPKRIPFENFKSNVCHYVKDKGDIDFIIETLSKDEIRSLYKRRWYAESFYLLAMIDLLSKENNVPLCGNYDDIRSQSLKEPLYPAGVLLLVKQQKQILIEKKLWKKLFRNS